MFVIFLCLYLRNLIFYQNNLYYFYQYYIFIKILEFYTFAIIQ